MPTHTDELTDGMETAVMCPSKARLSGSRFLHLLPLVGTLSCAAAEAAPAVPVGGADGSGLIALFIGGIGIAGLILIRRQSSLL